MSVWAERVAAAVEEGVLYVSSAEWEELKRQAPPPDPSYDFTAPAIRLGDLPVVVDDEQATERRRRAQDIERADLARLGHMPGPTFHL